MLLLDACKLAWWQQWDENMKLGKRETLKKRAHNHLHALTSHNQHSSKDNRMAKVPLTSSEEICIH